jgi:hypothetical protein
MSNGGVIERKLSQNRKSFPAIGRSAPTFRANDSIFAPLGRRQHFGMRNAYHFIFTYEGLEFQADKRVEQNNKTIASAVCRGIPAASQDSGE